MFITTCSNCPPTDRALIGLYDAPARAAVIARIERGADGRVHPEQLALAFFAANDRNCAARHQPP